ncbi:MAG: LptF/LptG family permease [Bacteroidia bacterium]|nr:LptF/LptG family permease [Bacteroidia bacterium]
MKKLHLLLVKSFIGPFIATFCISIFLMLMQFMWKYIGDLVGKGLEWYIILEFVAYSIPYLIPRALPLAVLLSTIMVFGNLGERYELVAMKSAGISLLKSMVPMFYVMVVIAGMAFYSSNVLIPKANLSWGALFYDVTNKKPALNIQDGIFFSELKGFSIRVGHKHPDNQTLEDVLIYSESNKTGITNVTIARRGKMIISDDERFMQLTLYDGKRFQEMTETPNYSKTFPHHTMQFEEYEMAIDMSELELQRSNPELFKDNYEMLNLDEINERVDSVGVLIQQKKDFLAEYLKSYFKIPQDTSVKQYDLSKVDVSRSYRQQLKEHLDTLVVEYGPVIEEPMDVPDEISAVKINKPARNTRTMEFNELVTSANQSTRNLHRIVQNASEEIRRMSERKRRYAVHWHKKFTLAFSCLLLFFIGAPIGAIIRKGGFGTPMIISILMFILYFILQTVGEKLAREDVLQVWSGAWFAPMIFVPIAIFLTYKSNTESVLFDLDAYTRFFTRLFKSKDKK